MGAQKPGFLRKYFVVASRLDEKPGFFGEVDAWVLRNRVFYENILL
jgi:hypothetical protein